uniref:RING-type domain-containing protein n=1 Tax=Meloidogyne incognita TaxID=6306 RepID=A0A914KYN1_MELIC
MMTGCDNPILYSEIYKLLPKNIQNKLEERMFEESIGMALLVNLERCKNCNFAIELEMDKKLNKVFDCIACNAQFCRICERDWDDEHIGLSCEEMDKKDKKEREIEKKLNEAIVRKCPRCGVQFVKEKGCNRMTCRCGMTQCYICREREIEYDHFCNEKKLNEAIVRKCPKCGIAFIKMDGCNKMTCRCGMTQCYICRQTDIQYDHFCPEKKLNEAIVRKCPKCGIAFIKMDGCNKMTCRCGMTQCYICRQTDIQYDHFCPHYRDPNNPNCNQCNKNCLQFEDANKRDEQLIKEIREKEGAKA